MSEHQNRFFSNITDYRNGFSQMVSKTWNLMAFTNSSFIVTIEVESIDRVTTISLHHFISPFQ